MDKQRREQMKRTKYMVAIISFAVSVIGFFLIFVILGGVESIGTTLGGFLLFLSVISAFIFFSSVADIYV